VLKIYHRIIFPKFNISFSSLTCVDITGSGDEIADLEAKIDNLMGKTPQGELACLMCGRTSNVKQNIRNHIETHVAKQGFTCADCGKLYRTRNSLNVHRSKHHKLEGDGSGHTLQYAN